MACSLLSRTFVPSLLTKCESAPCLNIFQQRGPRIIFFKRPDEVKSIRKGSYRAWMQCPKKRKIMMRKIVAGKRELCVLY